MTTGILILFGVLHAPDPDLRIGRVLIEGNTATSDRIILHFLRVHPGQQLELAKLHKAETRMRASGLFRTNPWRGTGPTVQVLENEFDGQYRDILVRIEERADSWVLYGIAELFEAKSTFDHLWDTLMRLRPHVISP